VEFRYNFRKDTVCVRVGLEGSINTMQIVQA